MASKYIYEFDIHRIYKTNKLQKVFIGSPKERPEEYVLIHVLNDKRFLQDQFKEQLKSLHNLVYLEDVGEELVFATKIHQQLSLLEYMKENKLDINQRLNLAYQYLGRIVKYDAFENDIINILVATPQLTVENKYILMNEALILEEGLLKEEEDFQKVAQGVGSVLSTILFTDVTADDNYVAIEDLISFISDLEERPNKYKSLKEIFHGFEALYEKSLQNMGVMTSNETTVEEEGKSPYLKRAMVTALILLGVTVAVGLGGRHLGGVVEAPLAYFEKVEIEEGIRLENQSVVFGEGNEVTEYLWEITKDEAFFANSTSEDMTLVTEEAGEYEVYLQVKDKYDNWSEVYSSRISVEEKIEDHIEDSIVAAEEATIEGLADLQITYETPGLVELDEEIFRNGEYALRFKGSEERQPKAVTLNDVEINPEENNTMSLWVTTDTLEAIDLEFEGYNQEHLIFQQPIQHYPRMMGSWDRVLFHIPSTKITQIKMTVISSDATIWVDDIKVDAYK